MAVQYDLNLRDYTRIMRKRKFIIIFSSIMLGLFSLVFSLTKQPIPLFKAIASVKIEKQTTVTGLYIETISWSEADTLETQAAIATSLPVVELAAQKLGIIPKDLSPAEIRNNAELLQTVLDLKNMVTTLIEGETNLVDISATSNDPRFSMKLANAVAEAFQEINATERNKRTIDARKFIEERLSVIVNNLKASQQELKALRQQKRFVSMDAHAKDTVRRLDDAEVRKDDSTRLVNEIDKLIEHLKFQKTMPAEKAVGYYSQKISPIFTTLNNNLDRLQLERNILLIDFTNNHPEVKRIDTEIESTMTSMLEHLYAEREKNKELLQIAEKDIESTTQVYYSLPEISFDLERIQGDIDSYKLLLTQLETKYQEILIKEAEKIQEITLIRPAILPTIPVNPPTTVTTTLIGTIIGFILGVVLAFVRETMDTSIGTIEDVEEFLGVPVVGVIPHMGIEQIKDTLLKKRDTDIPEEVLELNARLVSHFAPKSTIAESYRALRTGIEFITSERKIKSVAITSSSMREGKTTVICNYAMASAQIGKKVLLIDADLRKPMINAMFGIEREPGLSDIILGNYDWDEVIKTDTDIMMGKMGMEDITTSAPGIHNLNIITSGLIPPNSTEFLNSSRMSEILQQVKEAYDVVLVDTSPVLQTTDAVITSAKVDGVVMVYQVGQIARGALKRSKTQLEQAKATVIGVVLNGLKPDTGKEYRDYGYYGYYTYGISEGKQEPWYKRWFNIPQIVSILLRKIRGGDAGELPETKSASRSWSGEERRSPSRKNPGKKWLKVIILVVISSFIFYGLLWQFGILKY